MKIELAVRQQGHVPSFKNNKRSIKLKNGSTMIITDKKTKKWMDRCIQSFESQLFSGSATRAGGILTGQLLQSLIVSSMPLDDSRQWIPELHVLSEDVEKGNEGAVIIIERL